MIISLVINLIAVLAIGIGTASADTVGVKTSPKETISRTYTFAVIPYYTPEKIWTLFSPFVEYLSAATREQWQLKLYSNHDEFVEDMCNGEISVALAGPIPASRAYNTCGSRPFLVALAKNGKPDYHSVLVTNDESIRDLAGLKGRKIGLFKGSTAAHILPVKMLKGAGVSLSEVQPVFLESQDRIVSGLLSGELAAGGMKESLYQRTGKDRLRRLATSEALPNFTLCALPSFPSNARDHLVSALLRLKPLTSGKDAETVKTWDDEIKNGFAEPNKDFLPAILNLYSIYWEVTHGTR